MFSGPQATVLVNDDVDTDDQSLRRGVAGTLGALAGRPLVQAFTQRPDQ